MSSDSKALTLLTTLPGKLHKVQFLKRAETIVARQFKKLFRSEHETAVNAVVIGLLLWQAKAAVEKGTFMDWVAKNAGERAYRNSRYYMSLAQVFVEKGRLSLDERLAASTLTGKAPKAGPAKGVYEKLSKFIGEESLSDLFIKHGIKGVGLKSALTAGEEPPALTDAQQAEQQMELDWSQAWEPAKSLADLLAEKAATFSPEKRAALEAELKRALQALRAA